MLLLQPLFNRGRRHRAYGPGTGAAPREALMLIVLFHMQAANAVCKIHQPHNNVALKDSLDYLGTEQFTVSEA